MSRVAIAVCTYRRNELLRGALRSIAARAVVPAGWELAEVLVVDNDPAGGARAVAAAASDAGLPVRYVVEPVRGRAAARNRVLDETAGCDAVAMLDDDEEVGAQWPAALLTVLDETEADLVGGPVEPVFAAPAPPLARELFGPRVFPEGRPLRWLPTGNLVVRRVALVAAGLRFDPAYDRTGGEDQVLTGQAFDAGLRLVWCEAGTVREHVGPERLRPTYLLWRRAAQVATTAAVAQRAGSVPRGRAVAARSVAAGKAIVAVAFSWIPPLARRWGVQPGQRAVIVVEVVAQLLGTAGAPVIRPEPRSGAPR